MNANYPVTFTPDCIVVNDQTMPAQYSISPDTSVTAFVTIIENGAPMTIKIRIAHDDPRYPAALEAATGVMCEDDSSPTLDFLLGIESGNAPVQEPAIDATTSDELTATPEPKAPRALESKPAKNPANVPDKLFIGSTLSGKWGKIYFDPDYNRTRVIFKRPPSKAIRDAVKAAGFYWSPTLKSWNRSLSFKALRAAQELAVMLGTQRYLA